MKYLLIIIFLLLSGFYQSSERTDFKNNESILVYSSDEILNYIYYIYIDSIKNDIKKREAFVDTVYISPNGQPTIGWGHVILPTDKLNYRITKIQGDSILDSDFNYFKELVVKNNPNLKGRRLLAITSFAFNFGYWYYYKSNLKKLVDNNLSIDNSIIKYIKYKSIKTGKYEIGEVLRTSREFELDLYNKGLQDETELLNLTK